MNEAMDQRRPTGGIHMTGAAAQMAIDAPAVRAYLQALGLADYVDETSAADARVYALKPACAQAWAPGHDTTRLHAALGLDSHTRPADLEKEIVLALLLSPIPFEFPSVDELTASVRIRLNIVDAARKAALAFDTVAAERPTDYWTYAEDTGFTVKPGKTLIDALLKATQPDADKRYAFSCYRATEYVTVLGLAQELARSNPALAQALQAQWQRRAIMSGEFHEVFLREYGTMEEPLPLAFYVPGDRLWFRNPDEFSSNVEGYEGSWLFYLGQGLFNNFWQPERPFTLQRKCVEIYHWRHGTIRDAAGVLQMDDDEIERRVAATLADPRDTEQIVGRMLKLREPRGVYVDGGCIDATRECVRGIMPGTGDLRLPSR